MYHFQPYARTDPWLKAGAGYRLIYMVDQPGENTRLHGLEVINLAAGVDLRPSSDLALSPMIGAGLDTFLWDSDGNTIDDPGLSTFVYAGLLGRVDFGGSRLSSPAVMMAELTPTCHEAPRAPDRSWIADRRVWWSS